MDMKKILGIVHGTKEESQHTQLNENMEECGMSPMGGMPNTPPVSMSVNLNAQGVDNIKELLNLMRTAEAPQGAPMGMPMPAVGIDMPMAVTKIGGDDEGGEEPDSKPMSGGDRGMAQIRDLISKADKPEEAYANEPDEKYAGVDAVTASGDDMHKQKSMHRATAGGDNPMAVREASIRTQLEAMWNMIKEGKKEEKVEEDPNEGNEFANIVQKLKAQGAKAGTKFKTSDGEEHTLKD